MIKQPSVNDAPLIPVRDIEFQNRSDGTKELVWVKKEIQAVFVRRTEKSISAQKPDTLRLQTTTNSLFIPPLRNGLLSRGATGNGTTPDA